MLKLSLLSDLHIDIEGYLFNGINARSNFVAVLNEAVSKNPDIFILAGDLCNKVGDVDIYQWIKKQMDDTGIPTYYIPGNHDDATMMKEVFHLGHGGSANELFFDKKCKGHSLIFLDTSQGRMSDEQYNWLKEKIKNSGEHVMIFMHHPPLIAYAKHMEPRYSFLQMEIFQDICAEFKDKNFSVFTGHYHLEKTITKRNITTFITPSTYLQIHPDFEEFRLYHNRIGFREIILIENCLITNVSYLSQGSN